MYVCQRFKAPYIHSQLNWAILLCDIIPDGKNWVNCAVLKGNSAGLRAVLSSRLSHRELRSSLRESHSFLSLLAATTMASSRGTQPSKINKREATTVFIEVYRPLPELSDTAVTRTRRHAELTKKLTNLMGNLCCAREHSVQFFVQHFTQLTTL